MKRKILSLLWAAIVVLEITGCMVEEPVMCKIRVLVDPKGTKASCNAYVTKSEAPMCSFVTLVVQPDENSSVLRITTNADENECIQDETNPEKYKILVSKSDLIITVQLTDRIESEISKSLENCTLTVNAKAKERELVEFTVEPFDLHVLKSETVKVKDKNNNEIKIIKDEINPLKYSFYMPDSSVKIYAECESSIKFTPTQTYFMKNESASFNIQNSSTLTTGDVYYSYSDDQYKELLEENVNLSAPKFTYIPVEAGEITYYVKRAGETVFAEVGTGIVRFNGLSENADVLSFHVVDKEVYSLGSQKQLKVTFAINKRYKNSGLYVDIEAYYEDDPQNLILNTFTYISNHKVTYNFNYVYDNDRTLIVKAFNDGEYHSGYEHETYSDDIKISIPAYEVVSYEYTYNSTYDYLYFDSRDSLLNAVIEYVGEAGNYVESGIDQVNKQLFITTKKPTHIKRKIKVKDDSGNVKAEITFTVDYTGCLYYNISKVE